MKREELYRKMMLQYGYNSPLQVSIELFTPIGNGDLWTEDGEISDPMEHAPGWKKESLECKEICGVSEGLRLNRQMELKAWEIKRKFVEDNIDELVKANPTTELFRDQLCQRNFYLHDPSVKHASFFRFPDNVTKEWAYVLHDFGNYWLYFLRSTYHVYPDKVTEMDHWPKHIQEAHHLIDTQRKRALRLYLGVSEEEFATFTKATEDKITAKMREIQEYMQNVLKRTVYENRSKDT